MPLVLVAPVNLPVTMRGQEDVVLAVVLLVVVLLAVVLLAVVLLAVPLAIFGQDREEQCPFSHLHSMHAEQNPVGLLIVRHCKWLVKANREFPLVSLLAVAIVHFLVPLVSS
jgi:hypothetical protein